MSEATLDKKDQKKEVEIIELLPEVVLGDIKPVEVENKPDGVVVGSEVLDLPRDQILTPEGEKMAPEEVDLGEPQPQLLEELWDESVDENPKVPSVGEKFLDFLRKGKVIAGDFLETTKDKASEFAKIAKPKMERVLNRSRDLAEDAIAVGGGMAKISASKLGEKAVELGGFLKDLGIVIRGEVTSHLESAVALTVDTFGKISNSDIVQGAVDRVSIFKNSMAEAWVGSGVDEFNSYIKEEELKVGGIEGSLVSRRADLVNLEQISKDVGFDVSDSAKKKLEGDIVKKEAELKSERDRIDTMKAENSYYEARRTGYLAKIEESKRNIADRIQAKIDLNSDHSEELQKALNELAANRKKNSGELEKLTTHFRELDRLTRETDSEGARRSAVSLMRQIGPRINELEGELIACNKDEAKILKRKTKMDSKLERGEEHLSSLGVSPRKKDAREEESDSETEQTQKESIIPTPLSDLEAPIKEIEKPLDGYAGATSEPEVLPEKQLRKKELKQTISIEEAVGAWNKEVPEFPLKEGSFYAIRGIKHDKEKMRSVLTSLMNKQHPFSPRMIKTIVNTGLDAIYKNK